MQLVDYGTNLKQNARKFVWPSYFTLLHIFSPTVTGLYQARKKFLKVKILENY